MTQLQSARKGVVTPEMVRVARRVDVARQAWRDEVVRWRAAVAAIPDGGM